MSCARDMSLDASALQSMRDSTIINTCVIGKSRIKVLFMSKILPASFYIFRFRFGLVSSLMKLCGCTTDKQ